MDHYIADIQRILLSFSLKYLLCKLNDLWTVFHFLFVSLILDGKWYNVTSFLDSIYLKNTHFILISGAKMHNFPSCPFFQVVLLKPLAPTNVFRTDIICLTAILLLKS